MVPGHMAAVLVAFAEMGAIRTNSNAGNERKLPPPATEFNAPAITAAEKRNPASPKDTRKNNFSGGWCHSRSARLAGRGLLAVALCGEVRFAQQIRSSEQKSPTLTKRAWGTRQKLQNLEKRGSALQVRRMAPPFAETLRASGMAKNGVFQQAAKR